MGAVAEKKSSATAFFGLKLRHGTKNVENFSNYLCLGYSKPGPTQNAVPK